LYSRAPKHVSNVVGWALKKTTDLPWVAHFSDPWMANGIHKRPMQRWVASFFERRILRDADAVIFVTQQAADATLEPYPREWRNRVHIIPPGYVASSSSRSTASAASRGPLKVVHAGAFYPNMRRPDTLIEGIRRLNAGRPLAGRLKITCLGADTT